MNPQNLASGVAEWLALREHLLAIEPDIDPATLRDTIDGETALMDVVAGLFSDARQDEAFATALNTIINETRERRDRFTARAERRYSAAVKIMEAINERRIERPEFTAYFSASPAKVVITDADAIPTDLLRKPAIDLAAIKAKLRAGEQVPGAVLGNGGQHMVVRWS